MFGYNTLSLYIYVAGDVSHEVSVLLLQLYYKQWCTVPTLAVMDMTLLSEQTQ
jgi:hypothetical protein